MKKLTGFKYQIQQELHKNHWQIIEFNENTLWWDDEHWIIADCKNQNIKLFICFIVDPMFEGHRKQGEGIYQVLASRNLPKNWNDLESAISSVQISSRKFELKLEKFITELDKYRVTFL